MNPILIWACAAGQPRLAAMTVAQSNFLKICGMTFSPMKSFRFQRNNAHYRTASALAPVRKNDSGGSTAQLAVRRVDRDSRTPAGRGPRPGHRPTTRARAHRILPNRHKNDRHKRTGAWDNLHE